MNYGKCHCISLLFYISMITKNLKLAGISITAALAVASCAESSGDLIGLENALPDYTNVKVLNKVNIAEVGAAAYDVNYMYNAGKLNSVSTSNNSVSYSVEYTGTQISRIVKTDMQGAQPQIITSVLSYSGNVLSQITGTITDAGTVSGTFRSDLIYSGAKPTQIKTTIYLPGSTVEAGKLTSDLEYTGNNLSKWIYTAEVSAGPVIVSPIQFTANFSNYDVNMNPYRTLPLSYTIATANFDIDGAGPTGFSSNNYQTVTIQTGGASQSENMTHIYDAAGYPTKTQSASAIWNFEYQNL